MIYQQRLGSAFGILLQQKGGRLLKLVFLVTSGPIHQQLAGCGAIGRKDRIRESKEKRKKLPSSAKPMDQLLDSLLTPPPSPIHNLNFRYTPPADALLSHFTTPDFSKLADKLDSDITTRRSPP